MNKSLTAPTRATSSKVGPLFLAVIIQVLIIFGTIFVVVLIPSQREDPNFSAKKTIYLPQRELEHQMAVSQFEQAAKPPMTLEKISVEAMTPLNLPKLPEIPVLDMNPIMTQPSPFGAAMFGRSDLGGMMEGLASEASSVSFLGVEDSGERILLVIDISTTVVNSVRAAGLSMEQIRDEAIRVIEQLNANTLFGVIQHARNFDLFKDHLVPATTANKEEVIRWIRTRFRTDGMSGSGWRRHEGRNGITAILEVAFNMQPDILFMLSDGGYYETPPQTSGSRKIPYNEIEAVIRRRQAELTREARIHVIGFGVRDDDRRGMNNIARRNDGRFREFR